MEEIENQTDECQHHWIIDTPNGPTSSGKCKKCGVSTEFRNSVQSSGWDRDTRRNVRGKETGKESTKESGSVTN